MMFDLREQVALVTGASRGLGRAIALALGEHNAQVVINYARSAERANELVAEIQSAGGKAIAISADVRDPRQVANLIYEVEMKLGPVAILVNNATGPQPMKPCEEYTWQEYQDQLDYFIKAPVLLLQQVLSKMKEKRHGRVINIGSEVVDIGNANFSAYVAAKAGMLGLTRSLASELGPYGITVNLIAPGWIPVERHVEVAAAELSAYCANVPLGRQGVPSDIGAATLFLASDEGGFISGQSLSVNGGRTF